MATALPDVFGIATHVNISLFVNRGGLDELLGYYLKTERHVAIHGGEGEIRLVRRRFVRGMKRMTEGLEVYKHMLRAFTARKTEELLAGIDSRELPSASRRLTPARRFVRAT